MTDLNGKTFTFDITSPPRTSLSGTTTTSTSLAGTTTTSTSLAGTTTTSTSLAGTTTTAITLTDNTATATTINLNEFSLTFDKSQPFYTNGSSELFLNVGSEAAYPYNISVEGPTSANSLEFGYNPGHIYFNTLLPGQFRILVTDANGKRAQVSFAVMEDHNWGTCTFYLSYTPTVIPIKSLMLGIQYGNTMVNGGCGSRWGIGCREKKMFVRFLSRGGKSCSIQNFNLNNYYTTCRQGICATSGTTKLTRYNSQFFLIESTQYFDAYYFGIGL